MNIKERKMQILSHSFIHSYCKIKVQDDYAFHAKYSASLHMIQATSMMSSTDHKSNDTEMPGVKGSCCRFLTPVQSCETRNDIKQLQSRPGILQFINFPRFKENIRFEWEEASPHHSATDQFAKSYSSLRKQFRRKYLLSEHNNLHFSFEEKIWKPSL